MRGHPNKTRMRCGGTSPPHARSRLILPQMRVITCGGTLFRSQCCVLAVYRWSECCCCDRPVSTRHIHCLCGRIEHVDRTGCSAGSRGFVFNAVGRDENLGFDFGVTGISRGEEPTNQFPTVCGIGVNI